MFDPVESCHMAEGDATTFEGWIPVAVRCGECKDARLDDLGAILGLAYRCVNPESYEIEWWWAPMKDTRPRYKWQPTRRPGPFAFRLNDSDSADQPRVAAQCKNGGHSAYRVPRLRLASIVEAQLDHRWKYAHLGSEFAVGRATGVQQGTR